VQLTNKNSLMMGKSGERGFKAVIVVNTIAVAVIIVAIGSGDCRQRDYKKSSNDAVGKIFMGLRGGGVVCHCCCRRCRCQDHCCHCRHQNCHYRCSSDEKKGAYLVGGNDETLFPVMAL
jgi:hypothetical protein